MRSPSSLNGSNEQIHESAPHFSVLVELWSSHSISMSPLKDLGPHSASSLVKMVLFSYTTTSTPWARMYFLQPFFAAPYSTPHATDTPSSRSEILPDVIALGIASHFEYGDRHVAGPSFPGPFFFSQALRWVSISLLGSDDYLLDLFQAW